MLQEMPANFPQIKFAVADADEVPSLVESFNIDAVPSVVMMHPHKVAGDIIQSGITPEWLTTTVSAQN